MQSVGVQGRVLAVQLLGDHDLRTGEVRETGEPHVVRGGSG
ncbi:hypothetical protein [Streptomyces brevispora]